MEQNSGFEPPPAPLLALCYRYTNLAYPQPELHRGRRRRSRFYGAQLIEIGGTQYAYANGTDQRIRTATCGSINRRAAITPSPYNRELPPVPAAPQRKGEKEENIKPLLPRFHNAIIP